MSNRIVNVSNTTGRSKRSDNVRFETFPADVPSAIDCLMAGAAFLPEQMPSASGDWPPEKKLAAAVLMSALTEIRMHHGQRSHRGQVAESLAWVRSDDTSWPFSFLRLCTLFVLDPDAVRAAVEGWTRMPQHERERKRLTGRHAA